MEERQRLDAFTKVAKKFVREAKQKISQFGDTDTQALAERIDALANLVQQKILFSEEHLNNFLAIWRESVKIGFRFSKELLSMKETLIATQELLKDQQQKHSDLEFKMGRQLNSVNGKVEDLQKQVGDLQKRNTEADRKALKLKAQRKARKEKQRYCDWLQRVDRISAFIRKKPWDVLAGNLAREGNLPEPWLGEEHLALLTEVLPKLDLRSSTWEESHNYKNERNKDVHDEEIRTASGLQLKKRISEDSYGITQTSLSPRIQSVFRDVLKGLHYYHFGKIEIEFFVAADEDVVSDAVTDSEDDQT